MNRRPVPLALPLVSRRPRVSSRRVLAGLLRVAPVIALAVLAPGIALAQTAATDQTAQAGVTVLPSFEVSTTKDVGYRASNSVSATRVDTPISDLPFAISAFTQQFIQDTAPTDLYDIVRYAAGVTSGAKEFNAGADSFTIRGFQQSPERNGFNEGQGNIYVDPVMIERVEVVKGPSALLYGQVAPGGTVNYITKTPQEEVFANIGTGVGSYNFFRETLDVNAPIVSKTLLFRVNAAYENGLQYEHLDSSTNKATTRVIAPSLTWNVAKNVTLKLNFQSFYRYEDPAAVYPLNMDVATPASIVKSLTGPGYGTPSAALTSAVGVDAAAGYKDAADTGFAGRYPALPNYFNYDNASDWRRTVLTTYDAELDVNLGEHWVARADFDYSSNNTAFNQTGVGDVFIAPPGSLTYTPGAGGAVGTWAVSSAFSALSTAAQVAAESAFAQQILSNPGAALQSQQSSTGASVGNPGIIGRRPRDQLGWGHVVSYQADFAGKYGFSWGTIKPLIGFYDDESWNYGQIFLNTGSATSPYYQTWDVSPTSPTYYVNHNPTPILPSQYTSLSTETLAKASDQAAYAVLNFSLLNDQLYVIAGARYNQSQSISTNYLGSSAASIYQPGFKAHYTTPQVGAGFKVTKDSMLYASYSTGYTFGGGFLTQPQIINGVATSVTTGEQKPITSEGEEVGYKTDFLGGRLSSTLSVYRIVQSNGVQTVQTIFPTGTLSTSVQGVTTRSQGVEYEITCSPIENLQIFASIAEDDVRITQEPVGDAIYVGAHPNYTSKTLGNVWSRYNFSSATMLKGLWVGAGVNYVSPSAGNAVNPFFFYPSYTLWNSGAGYDWKWGHTQASFLVKFDNMSNTYYQPADQEVGLPRRVSTTLTLRF